MRSVEPNIQREPSIVDVFEHAIIGGVRIDDDATVTSVDDAGTDQSPCRAHHEERRIPLGRARLRGGRGVR